MFVVEEHLYILPQNIMKHANSFYWTFIDTLIMNVATIAAIVVGLCQFLIRAYNENNGPEKTRKMMQTVLQFVETGVAYATTLVSDSAPVSKVSTKRTKGA